MDPFSYQDKHVVLTGASSGVGAALVAVLRSLDVGRITAVDRQPCSGDVDTFIETDLADPAAIDALIGQVDGPVDVLFNNAGVAATLPTPVVLAVNTLAPRRLALGLIDQIPAGGAIVTTASTAGSGWAERLGPILELLETDDWPAALAWIDDHPDVVADPYAFSKECAQVFTMWASKAASSRGVRIAGACPGVIETPLLADFTATMTEPVLDWMIAQGNGRRATAGDIANVLAFLGSDAAAYVHGANLIVDGGFTGAMLTNQVDYAALGG
jgi:NAD(P)-dependent dehydrogenase (short-subunit alcohol dehydrogenase family)